ncbi:MAG: hypothetical protein QOE70_678 [Chthoniobacter sp.]|jgi:hypothetical protein|nr:hypothetical protein [Chthoniobacter sp.]
MKTNLRQRLRKAAQLAALGFAAIFLAGCGPDEFVLWSPDGQHAYVNGEQALLVDGAGRMLGPVFGREERVAGWLPDSLRIIVVRTADPRSWDEYAQLLGPERAAFVTLLAQQLSGLITNFHDDWTTFGAAPAVKAWKEYLEFRGEDIDSVVYYLDQKQSGLLAPLVEATARIVDEKREDTTGLFFSKGPHLPHINELHLRDALPSDAPADQLLLRLPDAISWACSSPLGRSIAFVSQVSGEKQLFVVAIAPNGTPIPVDPGVEFAAWSSDGRNLAYARTATPKRSQAGNLALGTITSVTVCTPSGDVLPKPEGNVDHAGLKLPERPRVAWLPDGRILFASARLTLPATIDETPQRLTLFAVLPTSPTAIDSLVPDQVQAQLPGRVDCFVLSPDGKKVAIPDDSGAVSVLFLETGTIMALQAEIPNLGRNSTYSAMSPAWRTSDELSYVVPAGDSAASPARGEVVIATLHGGKHTISKAWPDGRFLPPNLADRVDDKL